MSADDTAERNREAAGWLAIAREDIRVARACLALDPPARGVAAYHCQQAAEKLVKGLLVAAAVPFRKTHDMDELADQAASHYPNCPDLLDAVRPLTVWGFAYRYPGMEDIPEPAPDEAELRRIIGVVEHLADELQAVSAAGEPDPGDG
jgi:HEPN domain-containing protein